MNSEEIKRLGELERKATKAPWIVESGFCGAERRPFLVRPGKDGLLFGTSPTDVADMGLTAELRSHAPALLALAARAERMEKALRLVRACGCTCFYANNAIDAALAPETTG